MGQNRGRIGVIADLGYVVTAVARTPLLPAIALLFLALGAALLAGYRAGR